MNLPPCGLYRTSVAIGGVPAGRLVYFHNHGEPGPGVYLPESWRHNRARFRSDGTTLPSLDLAETLEPLRREGLYRVGEAFHCCHERCAEFTPSQLVQLGYNGQAHPILFVPRWTDAGLEFPERGYRVEADRLTKIEELRVARAPEEAPPGTRLH